jgi:alkane 1-monooxygenase
MDKRVVAHFDGNISRANITARKRMVIVARYGGMSPSGPQAAQVLDVPTLTPVIASADVVGGRCPRCNYVYDEVRGDPREGFPAGTPWRDVPDSWCCPDCGVSDKIDFVMLRRGAKS